MIMDFVTRVYWKSTKVALTLAKFVPITLLTTLLAFISFPVLFVSLQDHHVDSAQYRSPLRGGGLAVGGVFSLMFFKRRAWPLTFGLGTGFGMGYSNCQRSFDEPYLVRADRVKVRTGGQQEVAGPESLG